MNAIQVKNVTKRFKDVIALDDVTITFEHGKIYGLLGRNGAGKSTLLNVITNRIFADEGMVIIDDLPASENDEAQHKVFMMSEANLYPKTFKVKDVFIYTKQFYGDFDMDLALRLCDIFSLSPKKKIMQLSTGYTSIFKLITALSVNVPYIFFDEPVLGLDANHRDVFYKILIECFVETGNTYVISTHLIEEISNLIEDIIILKDGNVIREESCDEMLQNGYTITGKTGSIDAFIQDKQVIGFDLLGGLKTAYILGSFHEHDIPEDLEVSKMDLQKLFIQLTNNGKEHLL